jgi:hypothetical protein
LNRPNFPGDKESHEQKIPVQAAVAGQNWVLVFELPAAAPDLVASDIMVVVEGSFEDN